MLACVERPGAPSNPMKMAQAGPPFLSLPRPRPLCRFRAWRCTQVPATATRPPPGRRATLSSLQGMALLTLCGGRVYGGPCGVQKKGGDSARGDRTAGLRVMSPALYR